MPSRRSLSDYQAKRDFSRSPEPTGGLPQVGKPRAFCIQKHLASHLHYDFRLEHRGVLLSWAVPKGPSLDPSQKRLAMMVEDHPFDYRTFEGVIPSGYGAGIVVLWDQGLWQPLVEDVDAALAKGELKFLIAGSKLHGSWVLVRTSRGGDKRTWLLIKHRDQYASSASIIDTKPGSVHDGAGFAQILARTAPAQWPLARPGSGDAAQLLNAARTEAMRLRKPGARSRGAVWDSAKPAQSRHIARSSPAKPSANRSARPVRATAARSLRAEPLRRARPARGVPRTRTSRR